MTPKEAIKRIQNHNEIHSKNENFAFYITEALNMAISALAKQIPKKVKTIPHITILSEKPIIYTHHCPTCDALVKDRESWNYKNEREEYCYRCGQALDWRDEK